MRAIRIQANVDRRPRLGDALSMLGVVTTVEIQDAYTGDPILDVVDLVLQNRGVLLTFADGHQEICYVVNEEAGDGSAT